MPLYELDGKSPRFEDEDSAWVAPDASVMGDIRIGRDVGIWFGAVLRGDNEPITIGSGTNVQEHTVMHTDMGFPLTVGENCTVGHRAILHGCTIGDNSLIVGAPAKAVRTLDEASAERLKASAENYVSNQRRFKKGLKPL